MQIKNKFFSLSSRILTFPVVPKCLTNFILWKKLRAHAKLSKSLWSKFYLNHYDHFWVTIKYVFFRTKIATLLLNTPPRLRTALRWSWNILSSFSNMKRLPREAWLSTVIGSHFRFNAFWISSSYFWRMLWTVLSFRFGKEHLNFLNVLTRYSKFCSLFPILYLSVGENFW